MSTSATVIVKKSDHAFAHVRVNFDGYPSHMLVALANVTDEQLLDGREIRFISAEGGIEFYPEEGLEVLPMMRKSEAYAYARNDDGDWIEV